jgi:hypothetical protein
MLKAVLAAVVDGGLLREQTASAQHPPGESRFACSDIGLSQLFCRDGLEFVNARTCGGTDDDTPLGRFIAAPRINQTVAMRAAAAESESSASQRHMAESNSHLLHRRWLPLHGQRIR